MPRIAELAERGFSRRSGLVASIGARQLSRRPLRYTRSALLLMLAAALGTFPPDAATWAASQEDQATYAAAADLRDDVRLHRPAGMGIGPGGPLAGRRDGGRPDRPRADRRRPGDSQRPAARVRPGDGAGPRELPGRRRRGDLPPLLGRLAEERPPTKSVPVDGSPLRLAVVVDAAITADPTAFGPEDAVPLPPDWRIDVTVLLEDGDKAAQGRGWPG